MAITLYTDKRHETILKRLMKKTGIKTKNKLVLYIVEEYERLVKEREKYIQLSETLKDELFDLKSAVRKKIDADKNLLGLVK